jgi:hypothetical protein
MVLVAAILALVLTVLAVRTVWGTRVPDDRPWGSGWVAVLVSVMLLALYLTLLSVVVQSPQDDWNATRLAPSVSLTYGYDLYYGPSKGPITVMMYGPIDALVYLPSIFAGSPTGAVVIAELITILLIFFPLFLIHWQTRLNGSNGKIRALAGFCMASAAILVTKGTVQMATAVHADAPALGFGLLSCAVLTAADEEPGWGRLFLSAGLSVLSIWAKQVEATLILAIGTYLALAYGLRIFLRYALCTLVMGLFFSALLVTWFGWTDLYFNMFAVPARHPWFGPAVYALAMSVLEMAPPFVLFGSIVAVGIIITFGRWSEHRQSLGEWFRRRKWTLIVLVALFMVPTSLLGRVKWGGWLNAYHTLYYLICAASLVLVDLSYLEGGKRYHRVCSWALILSAILFIGLAMPFTGHLANIARIKDNPQEQAYRFALKYPGEAFFPWNTLSTLMAEGSLYHQEPGIDHREAAGLKTPKKLLLAHIPSHMKYLAYQRNRATESLRDRFPEFDRKVTLEELPGWIVYARGSP